MIIKKYGLELHRLTENDIELVRQKRNDINIRKKMFYQKEITAEEQLKWFDSINNMFNYYFIIHYKGKRIGLVHGKVLSYDLGVAEGGIFIWDATYQNSHIPVIVSICMTDLTFFVLNMNKTFAKVRMDNKVAIEYNNKLGYKEISRDVESNKIELELVKKDYERASIQLREIINKLYKEESELSWNDIYFTKEELQLNLHKNFPEYIQDEISKKMKNEKT